MTGSAVGVVSWASYPLLQPSVSLSERNPEGGPGTRESEGLNFGSVDAAEEEGFNRALWLALKGGRPYPGTTLATGALAGVGH